MAGIGFELKKLFGKRGVGAMIRAYGYAGLITTGPMILGILLLLGILILAGRAGLDGHSRDLLVAMVTYALLASLTVTSLCSMILTRVISDALFEGERGEVLPSFFGICVLLLPIGALLYGVFLLFAGIPFHLMILSFLLFCQMIVVWMAMNYLTAVKNYKGILAAFAVSAVAAFLFALLFLKLWGPSVGVFMAAVCAGYGIMLIWYVGLLAEYFPLKGKWGTFYFLRWFDKFGSLGLVGFFVNLGLFSHLVIVWAGPAGEQIQGLFYGCPSHDVAALFAFVGSLITTINFVVSVEVNFYPEYRNFYGLLNEKGSVSEIEEAQETMLEVLDRELSYAARKQLYATIFMVSLGIFLIELLPLGFNSLMEGYFQLLSVGYGLYAVGNMLLLILLYFTDYKGALAAALCFGTGSTVFTVISLFFDPAYYGIGFLAGSALFFAVGWFRLRYYTKSLFYHVLSLQPVLPVEKRGFFTRLSCLLGGERRETE